MRDARIATIFICLRRLIFMHTESQYLSFIVTARAESVGGSTPGVRVTWNTTVPTQCVTSVTVNFRAAANGVLVATNTTTNMSQTEIIQTGLRCGTSYYIRAIVVGEPRYQGVSVEQVLISTQVQVLIGGKEIVCMRFQPET